MRVLVTADTVGGVWTYTRELVSYLSRHGHEVLLVSLGRLPEPGQTGWLRELKRVDYHPTAFRLEWMQGAAPDLAASSEYLLRLIDAWRPDLLHFNQYCYGALETDLPKVVVAHSDVLSWWMAVHGQEPREVWIEEYRRVVARGIDGADVVVGVTHWMLKEIGAYYGDAKRTRVIHNGRSPALFARRQDRNVSALTVGRLWDCAKQAVLLTRCAGTMPITVAGDMAHPDGSVMQQPHSSAVDYVGPQTEDQLRDLYAGHAIYVGTSRYEPFGLAPLEAALSGCALLLNDIPSFQEVWGDDAIYFKRDDADSLRVQLGRLADDGWLRGQYARRSEERAAARYQADRMGAEYVALYEQLAATRELAA